MSRTILEVRRGGDYEDEEHWLLHEDQMKGDDEDGATWHRCAAGFKKTGNSRWS